MEWKKPSPGQVERFNAALPVHPDAQPRKMFGYPACFVKGNYFAGLHEDRFVVRLPGDLKRQFPELAQAAVFDPMGTGTGMKDWWIIPPATAQDDQRLARFLAAAFVEVHKLPAKPPKAKASGKAAAKKSATKKPAAREGAARKAKPVRTNRPKR